MTTGLTRSDVAKDYRVFCSEKDLLAKCDKLNFPVLYKDVFNLLDLLNLFTAVSELSFSEICMHCSGDRCMLLDRDLVNDCQSIECISSRVDAFIQV